MASFPNLDTGGGESTYMLEPAKMAAVPQFPFFKKNTALIYQNFSLGPTKFNSQYTSYI